MEHDPYLWLENVTGDEALDWVRARNAEALAELTETPRFAGLRDDIRAVLDADDRIPYVARRGDYLYNFWQDAAHPRGLWRRTTLESYRTDEPDWQVLIDVDALAADEGENWVWQGPKVLRPGYDRCLVQLSRGGADATVVREFDLTSFTFIDGFALDEAKSRIGWIDADHVFVGTDFGDGTLTNSGYPRIAKRWRRGTPLSEATVVFEGKPDDVAVVAYHDPTPGYERDFVARAVDFYRTEYYLIGANDSLTRIDVPDDAEIDVEREWLLVETRSEWTIGEVSYPAGALLAIRFDDFLAGDRAFTVLFEPDEHTSFSYHAWTRNHLIVATLTDVKSRLDVLTPTEGWRKEPLAGVPEVGTADIADTDPDHGDEFLLDVSGFTQPSTLHRGVIGGEFETLKRAPARFDADGLDVRQHFAMSDDGTRIPYFVVGSPEANAPTMLTGYGGFEISLTPSYSGIIGRSWLARGGTYVVANIRGGGEYGPQWHQSVQKRNRLRVYEDFAVVARDLVERGTTTPERLGIEGGSNGGLLTGVMLTRYPDLFGAVVSSVPLLDMLRYHVLLAGASWMAEYGDPDDVDDRGYLLKYSPYQNVEPERTYPPTLVMTSTRDDRVHPGHARKMVARMREFGHDVRYYENIEGGHGGAADNEQRAVKWALVFEFLWQRLAR
ncbi:MAG: prolyl oligopeptidase family serine peptidase [Actinophytocola sp.]|nr:prolyl oligopeptidase family serine peptidase [Actinophytocola sp.]